MRKKISLLKKKNLVKDIEPKCDKEKKSDNDEINKSIENEDQYDAMIEGIQKTCGFLMRAWRYSGNVEETCVQNENLTKEVKDMCRKNTNLISDAKSMIKALKNLRLEENKNIALQINNIRREREELKKEKIGLEKEREKWIRDFEEKRNEMEMFKKSRKK